MRCLRKKKKKKTMTWMYRNDLICCVQRPPAVSLSGFIIHWKVLIIRDYRQSDGR